MSEVFDNHANFMKTDSNSFAYLILRMMSLVILEVRSSCNSHLYGQRVSLALILGESTTVIQGPVPRFCQSKEHLWSGKAKGCSWLALGVKGRESPYYLADEKAWSFVLRPLQTFISLIIFVFLSRAQSRSEQHDQDLCVLRSLQRRSSDIGASVADGVPQSEGHRAAHFRRGLA